jgi:hypothetical protein
VKCALARRDSKLKNKQIKRRKYLIKKPLTKKGGDIMKHLTSKLLIVSAIIMILAAMPAFGEDSNGPYGTKKGNISEATIVSGCVISIREFNIDYITLCTNSKAECSESGCENVITIQGLGPEWYWDEPCIVAIDKDGNVDLDSYVCGADAVALPAQEEFVTIETITNSEGDYVAVWVQTPALQSDGLAVLLRNADDDYNTLWKGTGK